MRYLWILGVFALGCDKASELIEPEEEAPTEVVLTVDDEVVIADLTPMDQDAVCTALYTAINAQVPVATKCALVGIAGAGAAAEGGPPSTERCEELQATCEPAAALGEDSLPEITFRECGLFRGETSDCQTRVGDLRACMNLMAEAAADSLEQTITCALIDIADGMVPELRFPAPEVPPGAEACARLQLDCPGVFMREDMPEE